MGYHESAPQPPLRGLVEARWESDGPGPDVRVLPDGCMDLIVMDGRVFVAGPDTTAMITPLGPEPLEGLRFRPGVLPRLLGVPAAQLVGQRVPLDALHRVRTRATLAELANELAAIPPGRETAPWSLATLGHVTSGLAAGAAVSRVAGEVGWSARTLQRHCHAVYGYGPGTLRRILRFRRAVALLQTDAQLSAVAAEAGYSDQPHLHRDVREFAGITASALAADYAKGANRSTEVPSGSSTVA